MMPQTQTGLMKCNNPPQTQTGLGKCNTLPKTPAGLIKCNTLPQTHTDLRNCSINLKGGLLNDRACGFSQCTIKGKSANI